MCVYVWGGSKACGPVGGGWVSEQRKQGGGQSTH